jgi:aminoglycoside phosphotransferase (APT) family kinase protein
MTDPAAGQLPPNAHKVRADDAFDLAATNAWLTTNVPQLAGLTNPPQVRQFEGGASNLTYLLSYPGLDLVLRRPPAGTKASSAHDMAREFLVQDRLRTVFPCVPNVLALCQDHSVLGADFYVMEKIAGTIVRANLPPDLTLSPAQATRLCEAAIGTLADLHAVDPHAAGLSQLGRGPGYVQRQMTGWTKRLQAVRTWNTPGFSHVISWLNEVMPDDAGSCLIHNDFRLDNLVLAPGEPERVVGVLDWEMATIGDPLMDLGSALAYWVQADDDRIHRQLRRQPTHLPGMMTRRQVLDFYAERTGRSLDDVTFYEVFGLFRLAVILQQIYYRYHHGQTTNPAFKNFWLMIGYLDWRCRRLIRQSERSARGIV